MPKWQMILLFYISLSLILLLVAAITAVASVIAFLALIIGVEYFTQHNRGWAIIGVSYPLIAKIVPNFLFLMCFWICADANLIGLIPSSNLPD